MADAVEVRRARADDRADIVALATDALGWEPTRPNAELYAWKHDQNPFGESPCWVAEVDGRMAGFRTFLRWAFRRQDGSVATAVRAVDTATHPDFQGRGIFTTLTRQAVDDLIEDGIDFVFNTPNEKSRPGYLKMGWTVAGHVPVVVRPRARGFRAMLGARSPAEKWSLPTDAGVAPLDALADADALGALAPNVTARSGLVTDTSAPFLRWRYGFEPLHYRVLTIGSTVADGFLVVRRRQRGDAVEITLCDAVLPRQHRPWSTSPRFGRTLGDLEGDYVIATSAMAGVLDGFLPLPRQGPLLTVRRLATAPPSLPDLRFRLGDLELL